MTALQFVFSVLMAMSAYVIILIVLSLFHKPRPRRSLADDTQRIIDLETEIDMLRAEIAILRKFLKHSEPRDIPGD